MKTKDQVRYVPQVFFLADEEMLKQYQEKIKPYSKRAQEVLNIFTFQDGIIQGSNPFANVLLASEHLALPSQILQDSINNPEFFRNTYEDMGLILRTDGDDFKNNDYNARNLYEQLKNRDITPSEDNPVLISLRGLVLKKDKESHYGLIHLLGDDAKIVQAKELSHKNYGKKFSKVDERGIPIFDKSGSRTFYARQGGLDRVCLYRSLDLYSNSRDLAGSCADGRVAVAKK